MNNAVTVLAHVNFGFSLIHNQFIVVDDWHLECVLVDIVTRQIRCRNIQKLVAIHRANLGNEFVPPTFLGGVPVAFVE